MTNYIKFWVAKELAAILILAVAIAVPVSLFSLAVLVDWLRKFSPKRKVGGEGAER